MIARARFLAVIIVLAVGAIGVISSTQTWLVVMLRDGDHAQLVVTGAAAVPVLAPLSLAVLALGGALSIVGTVMRFAFGALTVLIAGVLGYLSALVAFTAPVSAVASAVTTATGITGLDGVAGLVSSISLTPWPIVTLVAAGLLLAAGVFTLATARSWRKGTRKYDADAAGRPRENAEAAASRPFDAIDSWDELSRGSDPTTDQAPGSTAGPSTGPR